LYQRVRGRCANQSTNTVSNGENTNTLVEGKIMPENRPIVWVTVENKYVNKPQDIAIIRDKIASVLGENYRVIVSPEAIKPISKEQLVLVLEETIQSLKK